MRRALPVLVLGVLLATPAAAATIRGGDLLVGSAAPDRIVGGAGANRIMAAFDGVDRVSCGAGRDLVDADLADHVSADCEVVARRLSVDPFTESGSEHETAVEPSAASSGATVVTTFQVGRFSSGGASGTGFAVTHDAGRTWRRGLLPGLGRSSDPTVAFDSVHRLWLAANLSIVEPDTQVSVVVSRSPDGLHWSQPTTLNPGPALDKEWIGCDGGAASPFRGRCYVVYSDDSHVAQDLVQASDDGGVTWSPPVKVMPNFVGIQPLIRPDGTLVVVAADAAENSPSANIVTARSTDGGATFSAATKITEARWHPPGQLRSFPLPSTTVDAGGTIYAVWHDCRFRASCDANDLAIVSSQDGVTWSPVTRVGIPGADDRFIPGLGADPTRPGRLGLVFAGFAPGSCAQGTCRIEIGFSSSSDAGAHWRPQQLLDAQPFPLDWLARTSSGRMIGDYMATAFANGRAVPVFTLATSPLQGRFREAVFGASLPVP
jgi:hypothetical protein